MNHASAEVLNGLAELDPATLINGIWETLKETKGQRDPEAERNARLCYTGPEIRCLLPNLIPTKGSVVGYALTMEIAPNDSRSDALAQTDHYNLIDQTPPPIMAVIKDVDSRPGLGAALGDGDAAMRKVLGVTGIIVDGTVRDLEGIQDVGTPVWAAGTVVGHGDFTLLRHNVTVMVAGLRIDPGDLLIAGLDGCIKIPPDMDPEDILNRAKRVRAREADLFALCRQPDATLTKIWDLTNAWRGPVRQ